MEKWKDIEVLIFDLGGIIIDIDPEGCFQRFMALLPEGQAFPLKQGLQHELLLRYELGLIETPEFLDELKIILQIPDGSSASLIAAWQSMLVGIQDIKIRLLQHLRQSYRVFLLSNTNHLHRLGFDAIVRENFGASELADYVHKAYYSYEMGLRKPDKAIYTHVLKDQNLDATKCLFFDDNQENVRAAQDCGMHAQWISADFPIEDWFEVQGLNIKN